MISPETSQSSSSSSSKKSKNSLIKKKDWNFEDYFHAYIRSEFVEDRVVEEGDFLIRKSAEDDWIVSVRLKGTLKHFQPAYDGDNYSFGGKTFENFEDLVYFHWKSGVPIGVGQHKAQLSNPVKHKTGVYKASDIQILSKLGQGNFGEVFKVRIVSENLVAAMKTLLDDVDENARENFAKEMAMLITMKHDNVVQCLGTVDDPPQVKILLEFINKGSLDKLLVKLRLTERGKLRTIWHVANGMEYLHKHNVIHRDLAARNILIHRNEDNSITAKVSDFGLSQVDYSNRGYELSTEQKLPLKWLAPECFTHRHWTKATDVWSFGVLAWEVWSNGAEPYADIEECRTLTGLTGFIARGGHPKELPDVHSKVKKIMEMCWAKDRKCRPTMHDLNRIIGHMFSMITSQNKSKP